MSDRSVRNIVAASNARDGLKDQSLQQNQTLPRADRDRFCSRERVELREDRRDMRFHGVLRDPEPGCDVLVREPFGQHPEHLDLTPGDKKTVTFPTAGTYQITCRDKKSAAIAGSSVTRPTAAASNAAMISSGVASRGSTLRAPERNASAVHWTEGASARRTNAGVRDTASGDSTIRDAALGGASPRHSTASSTTCGTWVSMSSASVSPDVVATMATEALLARSASSPARTTGDAAAISVRITPRDTPTCLAGLQRRRESGDRRRRNGDAESPAISVLTPTTRPRTSPAARPVSRGEANVGANPAWRAASHVHRVHDAEGDGAGDA